MSAQTHFPHRPPSAARERTIEEALDLREDLERWDRSWPMFLFKASYHGTRRATLGILHFVPRVLRALGRLLVHGLQAWARSVRTKVRVARSVETMAAMEYWKRKGVDLSVLVDQIRDEYLAEQRARAAEAAAAPPSPPPPARPVGPDVFQGVALSSLIEYLLAAKEAKVRPLKDLGLPHEAAILVRRTLLESFFPLFAAEDAPTCRGWEPFAVVDRFQGNRALLNDALTALPSPVAYGLLLWLLRRKLLDTSAPMPRAVGQPSEYLTRSNPETPVAARAALPR